jgi:hypothetical protein
MTRAVAPLRLVLALVVLVLLGLSGLAAFDRARTGSLNPVRELSAEEARIELASAQYVLGIVASQLARVHAVSGSYADTIEFDQFPLVTLVRADETSYCVEFEKTHTFRLEGPGGAVVAGECT